MSSQRLFSAGLSAVVSHVNQNKRSAQLFAFELKFELALGQLFFRGEINGGVLVRSLPTLECKLASVSVSYPVPTERLTDRQREVLQLVAEGKVMKEIWLHPTGESTDGDLSQGTK
jgi:DNA-binding NarL/FixJ family response regulator